MVAELKNALSHIAVLPEPKKADKSAVAIR
jgi:hypothetical protein